MLSVFFLLMWILLGLSPKLWMCVYLESSIIKEHHEGAVRFEPLQQIESGHVCIRHSTQVATLSKQKS